MFSNKINKISFVTSCLVGLSLLGYLIFCNWSPLGKLIVNYNFTKTPFTSGLWPETRTKEISCEKDCQQEITGQPVYLDILSPQKFEKADCQIEYLGEEAENLRLSLRENKNNWSYQTPTPKIISNNDGWKILTVELSLKNAQYEDNALRFSFSHKNLTRINSYQIKNFSCRFSKNTRVKTFLKKIWPK